ncbi:UNVERIFIED_ORG: hypothetical protein J2Y81_007833 [Paraburkholderia sediminicola]|nr:hypothetical protein [Paraburkholderia sediminicola]
MQMTNKLRCSARLLGMLAALASPLCWSDVSTAQTAAAPQVGSATATLDKAVLLTIFLRHDQSHPPPSAWPNTTRPDDGMPCACHDWQAGSRQSHYFPYARKQKE